MSGGMGTEEHVCNTSYKQSAPSQHRFSKHLFTELFASSGRDLEEIESNI